MARSDLLVTLVRAGAEGDQARFRRAAEAIIAEERDKNHGVLADRLASSLVAARAIPSPSVPAPTDAGGPLLSITQPRRTLGSLRLPSLVRDVCREIVEEQASRELLRSHALEPRNRILLIGPPGNGKTSLAEALAEAMLLPLFTLRYEAIVGSFLGETASRLARAFGTVRSQECVLFLDEFETLGKERGDLHETGEIKRLVSSLLLHLDDLPSHVVLVGATNHPELLDRASWRRFQVHLELHPPSKSDLMEWFGLLEASFGERMPVVRKAAAESLAGASFSDLEEIWNSVSRGQVLSRGEIRPTELVQKALTRWKYSKQVRKGRDRSK